MGSEDGNPERVRADEPTAHAGPAGADGTPVARGQASRPAAAEDEISDIGESTAGDGVAFFEGGDGREAARDDIERTG